MKEETPTQKVGDEPTAAITTIYGSKTLHFKGVEDLQKELEQKTQIKRIYSINKMMTGVSMATGLWLGNYGWRLKDGKAADFKSLAQQSKGIKRLGVLRADVDNLGRIFAEGFEQRNSSDPYRFVTISRYATLSRQLSLFFKHHLNTICREGPGSGMERFCLDPARPSSGPREVVIVYSGGDDVFLVGAWDQVIELALDLRQAFALFTGDALSFSAGIGLFRPGFPVSQMAKLTGILEERAKGLPGKDGIALFGLDRTLPGSKTSGENHVYYWKEFREDVCGKKLRKLQEWFDLAGSGDNSKIQVGKNFLYKLLSILRGEGESIFIARLAYELGRLEEKIKDKDNRKAKELVREASGGLLAWAVDNEDRRRLLTAINLLVYLYREDESREEMD